MDVGVRTGDDLNQSDILRITNMELKKKKRAGGEKG